MGAGAERAAATCLACPGRGLTPTSLGRIPRPGSPPSGTRVSPEPRNPLGVVGCPEAPGHREFLTCLSHFLWAKSSSPGLNADSLPGVPPPQDLKTVASGSSG